MTIVETAMIKVIMNTCKSNADDKGSAINKHHYEQ